LAARSNFEKTNPRSRRRVIRKNEATHPAAGELKKRSHVRVAEQFEKTNPPWRCRVIRKNEATHRAAGELKKRSHVRGAEQFEKTNPPWRCRVIRKNEASHPAPGGLKKRSHVRGAEQFEKTNPPRRRRVIRKNEASHPATGELKNEATQAWPSHSKTKPISRADPGSEFGRDFGPRLRAETGGSAARCGAGFGNLRGRQVPQAASTRSFRVERNYPT